MKQETKFSLSGRIKSFSYAINGLKILFRTEHNSRIHLVAAILVIGAGFFFHVSKLEWCLLLFSIGLVLVTEIINTAVEYLVDFVSPDYNSSAKIIKDLVASSVLISSICTLIIGGIIFLPKILLLLEL